MESFAARAVRGATSLLLTLSLLAGMLPAWHAPARAEIKPSELKTIDQIRDEAAKYDAAVLAISKIASLPLDTADQMKSAIATMEKHAPAAKFYGSKLVMMALQDKGYMEGLAKRFKDAKAGEELAKEVIIDPKAILRVEGAAGAQTRMMALLKTNTGKIKASADKMASAAQKGGAKNEYKTIDLINDAFLVLTAQAVVTALVATVIFAGPFAVVFAPAVAVGVVSAAFTLYVATVLAVGVTIGIGRSIVNLVGNVTTEEGQDAVEKCIAEADKRRESCITAAHQLPGFLVQPTILACWATWTAEAGLCWIS